MIGALCVVGREAPGRKVSEPRVIDGTHEFAASGRYMYTKDLGRARDSTAPLARRQNVSGRCAGRGVLVGSCWRRCLLPTHERYDR